MGTRNAFDALFLEHGIEQSSGAAVRISHEDRAVVAARGLNERAHGGGNAFRPVVELRRQTPDIDLIPCVRALERGDLVRQRAARDDQKALAVLRHVAQPSQCAAAPARFAANKPFAVSTATAASRQYASA